MGHSMNTFFSSKPVAWTFPFMILSFLFMASALLVGALTREEVTLLKSWIDEGPRWKRLWRLNHP